MLITERGGQLRIIRNGVLDPMPIAGVPKVQAGGTSGLLDIALHPKFATNGLVYMAYNTSKPAVAPTGQAPAAPPAAGGRGGGPASVYSTGVARGRFDGKALVDVKEIFVAEPYMALSGGDASRLLFAPDGTLFMSSSHHRDEKGPQDPMNDAGKILRLNDDGTIPKDNPFVGKAGYRPEIYSIGHRTVLGLAFHPTTGALWKTDRRVAMKLMSSRRGRTMAGHLSPTAMTTTARRSTNVPYLRGWCCRWFSGFLQSQRPVSRSIAEISSRPGKEISLWAP